ncbi:hypothetical protein TI05_15070 [Achromatium sp. WMS3]|nr:hypothetical protein TI05_15070 [Achromatium sp. WMS3]
MTLLFDQNLSPKLAILLKDLFPASTHVRNVGLRDASDLKIWEFAKQNGFTIISKDSDFQQKSFLLGFPPKVIWLRIGNSSVQEIMHIIQSHSLEIHTFIKTSEESYMVLSKK